MDLTIASRVTLSDSVEMPWLGLGVWQTPAGRVTRDSVRHALECGYRLIDTATLYGNETDVGVAVRESGVPRKDVFVTTKLWNSDHGFDRALRAFEESDRRLGLGYMDLYLIHWPAPRLRGESWEALVKIKESGRARSIGVSNYTVEHLEELLASSPVPPSVNQVEFHPFLYQRELLEYCRRHRIQLEAYSPLTRGQRLRDPRVVEIAAKNRRTPAQVLIRWGLQHGVVEIPKSQAKERIRENAGVFDFSLSPKDMAALDALTQDLHTAWDPTGAP